MLSSAMVESYVFPDSSTVEQAAVNRKVVGSNPTRGAIPSNTRISRLGQVKQHEACDLVRQNFCRIWLRRLSQRSALGKWAVLITHFRYRVALHPEHDDEFAAMMEIAGENAPDDRLPPERVVLPFVCRVSGGNWKIQPGRQWSSG